MLDSGDTRFNHFKGGIERIEIRVDLTRPLAAGEPKFQRIIGRTELEWGEANVVILDAQSGSNEMDLPYAESALAWGIKTNSDGVLLE